MKDFAQALFRSVVPTILLVLLTGGVVLDVLITEGLEEDFDELMIAKALGLIALAEDGDDGVEMENYEVTLPNYALAENAEYFQLVNDSGKALINSASLSYWEDSGHPFPGLNERDNQALLSVTLPDGRPGRLLRKRFVPRLDYDEDGAFGFPLEMDAQFLDFPGEPGIIRIQQLVEPDNKPITIERQPLTLQLAVGRASLDSLLYKVHSVLLLTGLSIMLVIVLLARRSINKAVKPLRVMAVELHDIDEQRFNERLRTDSNVNELHDLAQSVNVLLGRVDAAFERERRFSGDVAHELRTPLAELRTLLDVTERWPDDPAIKQTFSTDVRDVTDRMQRIVETLLQLSRSEQGFDLLINCQDLTELVRHCAGKLEQAAQDKRITLQVHMTDTAIGCIGLDQWQSICGNLMENAVEYATEGSQVDIELKPATDGLIQFSVTNQTSNLTESDLDNMFERLWQKDTSRTSSLHSGLGLALVRSCAKQIGGEVKATLSQDKLTILVVAPALA
ncbi:sensor histidine kinase [Granulosicoccus antarcticus]|nr:HAMP domain-containing sensor histidine kinase [Granulosicoccus antarcticus]